MKIDNCLILSAGRGVRMGQIGKELPKVLWPIYEKKLLELQLAYVKANFSPTTIFINSHHQHPLIQEFIREFDDESVVLVHEPELLGVGGAVHNVARHELAGSDENLLIINGDQFICFDNKIVETALGSLDQYKAVLFSVWADPKDEYNEVILNDDLNLIDIKKCKKNSGKLYLTYSGMSLINLSLLKNVDGVSNFFETVADYKNEKVLVITPDTYEYWDFGTLNRYRDSMFRLLNEFTKASGGLFYKFCIKNEVLDKSKIKDSLLSYGETDSSTVINLAPHRASCKTQEGVIVMESRNDFTFDSPGIYFNALHESLQKK